LTRVGRPRAANLFRHKPAAGCRLRSAGAKFSDRSSPAEPAVRAFDLPPLLRHLCNAGEKTKRSAPTVSLDVKNSGILACTSGIQEAFAVRAITHFGRRLVAVALVALTSGGCESKSVVEPYDHGYRDGVFAAQAQKSKGRNPDLKQTLNGRNDLGKDAGFEPGTDEHGEYQAGFTEGYNKEFQSPK
jgi:hypothetical protein